MSKASVINYFRFYPSKVKGFTVYNVAKFNQVSPISVYITLRRLKDHGLIKEIKSRGRGRGKGKTPTIYYFTANGLNWLRRYNIAV